MGIYTATDVPIVIPDLGTITSTINVTDNESVSSTSLEVRVSIQHNFTADLKLTLINPDGIRTVLADKVGGAGDDFVNTIFDPTAAQSITNIQAPFTGRYRPQGNMVASTMQGTWTLEVVDQDARDVGVLELFQLRANIAAPTVTITSSKYSLGVGETAQITFNLNVENSTFSAETVNVLGGSLTNFSGSNSQYTATFVPWEEYWGQAFVSVFAGSFSDNDNFGKLNTGGQVVTLNVDTKTSLAAQITGVQEIIKQNDFIPVTIAFNAPITTDLLQSQLQVLNGQLLNFAGSGTTYTALFQPTPGYIGPVSVILPAETVQTEAGVKNQLTVFVAQVEAKKTNNLPGTASRENSGIPCGQCGELKDLGNGVTYCKEPVSCPGEPPSPSNPGAPGMPCGKCGEIKIDDAGNPYCKEPVTCPGTGTTGGSSGSSAPCGKCGELKPNPDGTFFCKEPVTCPGEPVYRTVPNTAENKTTPTIRPASSGPNLANSKRIGDCGECGAKFQDEDGTIGCKEPSPCPFGPHTVVTIYSGPGGVAKTLPGNKKSTAVDGYATLK